MALKAANNEVDTEDINKKLNETLTNTTSYLQVVFGANNHNALQLVVFAAAGRISSICTLNRCSCHQAYVEGLDSCAAAAP